MALKQFYQTNFANGEFMKHKGAYALAILLGAAIVQFNGCETLRSSYSTVETKVMEIMDNYQQPDPKIRQYTIGG